MYGNNQSSDNYLFIIVLLFEQEILRKLDDQKTTIKSKTFVKFTFADAYLKEVVSRFLTYVKTYMNYDILRTIKLKGFCTIIKLIKSIYSGMFLFLSGFYLKREFILVPIRAAETDWQQ